MKRLRDHAANVSWNRLLALEHVLFAFHQPGSVADVRFQQNPGHATRQDGESALDEERPLPALYSEATDGKQHVLFDLRRRRFEYVRGWGESRFKVLSSRAADLRPNRTCNPAHAMEGVGRT